MQWASLHGDSDGRTLLLFFLRSSRESPPDTPHTQIVHESIADDFIALVKDHAEKVRASGDPNEQVSLRGLFSEASATRVKFIVDDALSKGAKIAAGTADVKDNVVQPLLLSGVTSDMCA